MSSERKKLPSLIAVIHLPPLAGTPSLFGAPADAAASLQAAGLRAVQEAQELVKAGFEGLIIENFGDAPFYKTQVPPETIASMAIIAAAVREAVRVPIGINVLRNDARAALAVAAVSGCDFIRVNVLSGVAATDQGIIEGEAAFLIRERERLGAGRVLILGDVHVKHARSLSSEDIELGVEEVALRSRAEGVIITGTTTGRSVQMAELERAAIVARSHGIPLYIGSGATVKNLADLRRFASGIIVGSAIRKGGQAGASLDRQAIRTFMQAYLMKRPKSKKVQKNQTKKMKKRIGKGKLKKRARS